MAFERYGHKQVYNTEEVLEFFERSDNSEEGISDIAEDDREENVRRDCDFGDIPDDDTKESCLHGEDSDITGSC